MGAAIEPLVGENQADGFGLPAKVAVQYANGVRVVTHAVMGDEEDEGFRLLASGELEIGQGTSAAQPPAR